MSYVDPKLKQLLIERLKEYAQQLDTLRLYFYEHSPMLADNPREYNELIERICLAMYASACQLDMAVAALEADK